MGQVDNRGLISSKNKDKYADFGKRKPIPGLKHENLFYRKEAEGATMHLFAGGIYDGKDGVNGGFAGLKGDIPLYDKGKLEVYGGVGNVAAAGAKFSHSIWQNDNFALKGYARAEGAVDLFGKREFTVENTADCPKTENHKDSVLAEGEGEVITAGSHYNEEIIDGIPIEYSDAYGFMDGVLGLDYNKIYHRTYLNNNYNIDMSSTDALKGDIFKADAKAAIGMEMEYVNHDGNLRLSLGGEIGRKGRFEAVSKMYGIDNDNVEQKVELESSHYNDGATFEGTEAYTDFLTYHEYGIASLESQEVINIYNKVHAAGLQTDLKFKSKWYGALKGNANYKIGRLELGAEAGVDYCDNKLTPTFKAGVSYLIGNTPIIHNHGARVLFERNPLNKHEAVYEDKNYPEAKLNAFVKGQAIDGVDGGAIGLNGKVPLNNITDLNISAGIGNIISADFNISQTNPTKWDDLSLSGSLGISGNISLTKKLKLETEDKLRELSSNVDIPYRYKNMEEYFYNEFVNQGMDPSYASQASISIYNPWEVVDDYTINEKYDIYCSNKCVLPNNSIKLYGDLNAIYQKDNLKVAIGVEGGYKSQYMKPEISGENSSIVISSEYQNKLNYEDINIDNGSLFNLNQPNPSEYQHITEVTFNITNENNDTEYYHASYIAHTCSALIRQPGGDCPNAGAYVFSGIEGNTNITLNSSSNGKMSFVPKFKPYITPTISAEYDIKDVGTVGAKASLEGASVTFSRRIK